MYIYYICIVYLLHTLKEQNNILNLCLGAINAPKVSFKSLIRSVDRAREDEEGVGGEARGTIKRD